MNTARKRLTVSVEVSDLFGDVCDVVGVFPIEDSLEEDQPKDSIYIRSLHESGIEPVEWDDENDYEFIQHTALVHSYGKNNEYFLSPES